MDLAISFYRDIT